MKKAVKPLARRLHFGRSSKSVDAIKHNPSDIKEAGFTSDAELDASPESSGANPTLEQAVQHAQTSALVAPSASNWIENFMPQSHPDVASTIDSGSEIGATWKPLLDNISAFSKLVENVTEVHPYLKVAWNILAAVPKAMKAQLDRDDAVLKLLKKMNSIYIFLQEAKELKSHKDLLISIGQKTLECAEFIGDYFKTVKFLKRLANNAISVSDEKVKAFSSDFDDLLTSFRNQSNVHTEIVVNSSAAELQLQKLRCATDAGRQSAKACLPNTRKEVIQEITDWINSSSEEASRVFWLYGEAGRGKSAIAHSVAAQFDALGRLGSCFCFDRNRTADARHEKVFTTIARDLAGTDVGFRKALASAIQKKPSIAGTSDISIQWQSLILEPLTQSTPASTEATPIIIDSLDESGDSHSRAHLLSILANRAQELPPNLRVLVVSRPLEDIRNILNSLSTKRDLAKVDARDDIVAYVKHRLERFPFFTSPRCETLAEKAEGLFQWAFVACEALAGPKKAGLSPDKRFQRLLNSPNGHTSLLDGLYTEVLSQIFNVKDDDVMESFASAMRLILTVFEPLPIAALDQIKMHSLEDDASESIAPVVEFMGSLLGGTGERATPIRLLHTSFREFLTTDDSIRNPHFRVTVPLEHLGIARGVLGVLESELHFNICRLETAYLPNNSVEDLDDRIRQFVSPQLLYATQFWVYHLETVSDVGILLPQVEHFLHSHVLHWLEVLSLAKRVGVAYKSLVSLAAWLKDPSDSTFQAVTSDLKKLIRMFASPISLSAPHIYLSVLPYIPNQSTLAQYFDPRDLMSAHVITQGSSVWPAIQNVMLGHTNFVTSVAFSPDGTRIVSGSDDMTVRQWSAHTGEAIGATLEGHTNFITSVAFSADGMRIASGSDDTTLRQWNAHTGEPIGSPLEGHTDCVSSVAISPDGTRIVSGSDDMTVRQWSAQTGEPIGTPLEYHTGSVNAVAFSPDGTRIISGSDDMTLIQWSVQTGEPIGAPLEGHTDSVTSVACSSDGARIVSGSWDKTILQWSAQTGEPIGAPLEGHTGSVNSVTFSSDGTKIVSGSNDTTVRQWNAHTGEVIGAPLDGHTNFVTSVAFSPDGTRIVSGSDDMTMRQWSAHTEESIIAPLEGITKLITSVAFSPDGKRIGSGSFDTTVQQCDAQTGEAIGGPLEGHRDGIVSVAFSYDGTRIASGSMDETVRLWNAQTGEAIGAPLEGHLGSVNSVAFSPDGARIVSGSDDTTVRQWNVQTREPIGAPLEGHAGWVTSVAFSPDGTRIVSGSRDKTVRQWSVRTGEPIGAPLQGHTNWVTSVAFSSDVAKIVSGSWDKTVRRWNAQTGELIGAPLEGHTNPVIAVAFSPDGMRIVSGSDDMTVQQWSAHTGEAIGVPLRGHTGSVISVAYSRNGTTIVSGSEDGTVRLWNVQLEVGLAHLADDAKPTETQVGSFSHRDGNADAIHVLAETSCIPENLAEPSSASGRPIVFSRNLKHSLWNQSELFRGVDISEADPRDLIRLNPDGWIVGPEGRLLLWIPPALRAELYTTRTEMIIGGRPVQLDLSRFPHGRFWTRCRESEVFEMR